MSTAAMNTVTATILSVYVLLASSDATLGRYGIRPMAQARTVRSAQAKPAPRTEERIVNETIPIFEHKGRTYVNAKLTKVTLYDAIIKVEGGGVRVKLQDLPEPFRTKYFDPQKIAAVEAQKQKQWEDYHSQVKAFKEAREQAWQDKINSKKPLRVIEGDLYDFSEVVAALLDERSLDGQLKLFFIEGKVLSVTEQGILVTLDDEDGNLGIDRVFLKNYSREENVVDGYPIRVIAVPVGRYQYVMASGGKATVPLYDCGRFYNASQDEKEFLTCKKVTETGVKETLFKPPK
jgi:hypothetical protein